MAGSPPAALRTVPALAAAAAAAVPAYSPNFSTGAVTAYRNAVEAAAVAPSIKTRLLEHCDALAALAAARDAAQRERDHARILRAAAEHEAIREALHLGSDADLARLRADIRRLSNNQEDSGLSVAFATATIDQHVADRIEREVSRGVPAVSWMMREFDQLGATYSRHAQCWTFSANAPARDRMIYTVLARVWSELFKRGHHPIDREIQILIAPESISDADADRLTSGVSLAPGEYDRIVGLRPPVAPTEPGFEIEA
jgi:hypothetical protein